jgi:hypothetical protein
MSTSQINLERLPAIGFAARAGIDGLARVYEKRALGLYSLYYSVLVVRGIGYRILYNGGELAANFQQVNQLWGTEEIIPEN